MQTHADTGVLDDEALTHLQDCFDTILVMRGYRRGTVEAERVAQALLSSYRMGVRSKDELLKVADL